MPRAQIRCTWSASIADRVEAPDGESGEWYSLCSEGSKDNYDYPRVRIFNSESEACLDMLCVWEHENARARERESARAQECESVRA